MATAEFEDDDLSDDIGDEVDETDEVDDEVDLDALPDLDDEPADDDADPVAEDEDDADATADDEEDEDDSETDDDEAEESLDVLLAREKVLDEDDLGRIATEARDLNVRPALVGEGEFTCRSCFLVKRRAQLAHEKRLLCFDCV